MHTIIMQQWLKQIFNKQTIMQGTVLLPSKERKPIHPSRNVM